MASVILRLPDVKRRVETRPQKCPYCQGDIFQRWGQVRKPVRDNRYRSVKVYRYRCCHCGRTFRHYPQGVDQADQTQRLRKLAAIFWVLGMSLRGVVIALGVFGVNLSHMTVWRDLQEQTELLKKRRHGKPVRVLGVDGLYPLLKGKKAGVLLAVDLGNGQPVAIGQVNEANPQALYRFLEPLVTGLGVRVMVSDDLHSFRQVAEKLEVEHQVCQFHVRRWVGRSLRHLKKTIPKEWLWVIEDIQTLLAELPPEGGQRLFELWKQVRPQRTARDAPRQPLEKLRQLLLRLSKHWASYRVFTRHKEVPWTNNTTEQVIGRMKMRSRTVRGYKSWPGMQAALLLSGSRMDF